MDIPKLVYNIHTISHQQTWSTDHSKTFKLQKSRNQNTSSLETFCQIIFALIHSETVYYGKRLLSLVKILHHNAYYNVHARHSRRTPILSKRHCFIIFALAFSPPISQLSIDIKNNSYQCVQGTSIASQAPTLCFYLLEF